MDMESQIELFDFTTANGSEETAPNREANYAILTKDSWLVLAKIRPVTYKIQCHPQADPEVVHVEKIDAILPRFWREAA